MSGSGQVQAFPLLRLLSLLQWCCSVDQAPAGWSLCGLEVTMSPCAGRKDRCEYDIPSSFPDGPVKGYWEKNSGEKPQDGPGP